MTTTSPILAATIGAVLLGASAATGAIIEPATYRLNNHPDGSANPPAYGLRLDELIDVTGGHDKFTFDFDADGAEMNLRLTNDGRIRIFGTAFGGLDTGTGYDDDYAGFVEIDFTYQITQTLGGDDDIIVTEGTEPNAGSITLWNGDVVPLFDYADNSGLTFQLGNEANDQGHRGFDGISGWGWLTHGLDGNHVAASDWLFTLNPEPVPGPAGLAALACLAATGRRRRRD